MEAWCRFAACAGIGVVFLVLLSGCEGAPPPPTPTSMPAGTMTPASLPASMGIATPTVAPPQPGATTTGQPSPRPTPTGAAPSPTSSLPLSTATGLPGINRVVLIATPDHGSAPLIVRFAVEVTGHFTCEGERWDFGEGTPVVHDTYCAVVISPTQTPGGPTATPKLPTPPPTVATLSYGMTHTYNRPGTYRVQFALLGRGGAADSNIVTIVVQ